MEHKTIHISIDLHKKLKLEAIRNNLSLRELVEAKLDTGIGQIISIPVSKK